MTFLTFDLTPQNRKKKISQRLTGKDILSTWKKNLAGRNFDDFDESVEKSPKFVKISSHQKKNSDVLTTHFNNLSCFF